MLFISPIYNCLYPASLRTAADEHFGKIRFIHGTNSSVLTALSQTNYQLLATGDLLNRGIAPMSGELTWGGMNYNGLSQTSICGGSIDDVDKCWKTYALDRSNSFNPDELTPAKFAETLDELEKTRQTSDRWDLLIISLMRYKQWKPEEFTLLCTQNQARIDALVKRTKPQASYADLLLKALDYDEEKLKKGIDDLKIRKEILEEFDYEWSEKGTLMNSAWSNKWQSLTGLETAPGCATYPDEEFSKSQFEKILADIINIKLTGNLHKEVTCFQRTWNPYNEIHLQLSVRRKPEDTRYKRLHLLFDPAHQPMTFRTLEQKESVLKPFPLLLGSTSADPSSYQYQLYIPSGATLGTDIDVMIVRPQDQVAAAKWLKAHFLAHKIALYSAELLKPTQENERASQPPPCTIVSPEKF